MKGFKDFSAIFSVFLTQLQFLFFGLSSSVRVPGSETECTRKEEETKLFFVNSRIICVLQ